jgi:cation:H+ antiporter
MMYLWLIIGFVCLIKGADFFVDGSSSVAKLLKIPSVIIGLTIVAMGTSAPETAVSIAASCKDANALAVSNVVGSNFFNLLVVVGICALMQPVIITKDLLKRDYPYSIAATFVLLLFLGSNLIFATNPQISRIEGILMLVIFAFYLAMLIRHTIKARNENLESEDDEEIVAYGPVKSVVLILVGLAGVVIGGDLVVDNAKLIAASLGMDDTLIGLTVVALGTSLPELVTSIVASRKGENDMALGNVVGSNIFNILLVLGISSSLLPITVGIDAIVDTILLIVVNLAVLLIVIKDHTLSKKNGVAMLLMYAAYTAFIFYRNYFM